MKDVHELPVRRLNFILELLLDKAKLLSNIDRDQPLEWSIMHMYSCSQLAKLLAIKRGINPEIAGIAGAIHDLAIIETGIFKDHGP
ncbi:MAG: phosphohydrolase, partial [Candidatus Heimdallarchaeota archaeon]|nr:phosphohydrolase [Candidatus Heimdallarchaeota archaeon]